MPRQYQRSVMLMLNSFKRPIFFEFSQFNNVEMIMLKGHLDEIFFSIQGEGGELGLPHLFCRFGGCPLRCVYCDTPRSWNKREQFECHSADGTLLIDNPIAADSVVALLKNLLADHPVSAEQVCLSLTGGEVLEQAEFAVQIAKLWPGDVMLETSGSNAKVFSEVASEFDVISLDWKTPSLMTGDLFAEHQQCLEVVAERNLVAQLKMVLSSQTTTVEVTEMYDFVAKTAAATHIYLQPLTKVPLSPEPPSSEQMLKWLTMGIARQLNVRVLPQVHPLLNAR